MYLQYRTPVRSLHANGAHSFGSGVGSQESGLDKPRQEKPMRRFKVLTESRGKCCHQSTVFGPQYLYRIIDLNPNLVEAAPYWTPKKEGLQCIALRMFVTASVQWYSWSRRFAIKESKLPSSSFVQFLWMTHYLKISKT
jgi:hypothetical protein